MLSWVSREHAQLVLDVAHQITRLRATVKALADPAVEQALKAQGLNPAPIRGVALSEFLASEMKEYTAFISKQV